MENYSVNTIYCNILSNSNLLYTLTKALGVHTTLDTSGFADIEKVQELLEYTDLVLLDIKHAVDEKHRTVTGVGNEKTVRFAQYCSQKGIPLWIRYVLVPGYTDAEEDLKLAAQLIGSLKSVQKIEVLPYHSMGAFKWEKLGKDYQLKGVREPSHEEVKKAQAILENKKW